MEHFQWKQQAEISEYVKTAKEDIGEELADVLYWLLLMSHDLDIDLLDALEKKIEINATKYPVEKAKGNHIKYNKF